MSGYLSGIDNAKPPANTECRCKSAFRHGGQIAAFPGQHRFTPAQGYPSYRATRRRSGLVDLVVGVGGHLGGAHCLAPARKRFVAMVAENLA